MGFAGTQVGLLSRGEAATGPEMDRIGDRFLMRFDAWGRDPRARRGRMLSLAKFGLIGFAVVWNNGPGIACML
ncbi:hypothetical protein DSO57_1028208 [Entomophthora muscae]|uniref:Uncharacterized protein n=1 Tax=Entomophthora muscae TaxID=34485 RepID=A0ACC2T1K4_9FUNG|nr:hypothetical protein DSO57_1028208 [Entomophthora muscae]